MSRPFLPWEKDGDPVSAEIPWEPVSKQLDEKFKSLKSVSVGLGRCWFDAVRGIVKLLAYLMCLPPTDTNALDQDAAKQTTPRTWLVYIFKTFNEIMKYSYQRFQGVEVDVLEHVAALRICKCSLSNFFGDQPDKLIYNDFCSKTFQNLGIKYFGSPRTKQLVRYADAMLVVQVWKVISLGCLELSRSRDDYVHGEVDNWLKENKDVEHLCSEISRLVTHASFLLNSDYKQEGLLESYQIGIVAI